MVKDVLRLEEIKGEVNDLEIGGETEYNILIHYYLPGHHSSDCNHPLACRSDQICNVQYCRHLGFTNFPAFVF
jgi:hypothetical protein